MKNDRGNGKRESIFSAAISLFVEKGYSDTKMIDIAMRAGIGKGTIYEYFESKESLFRELFHFHATLYYDRLEKIMASVQDQNSSKQLQAFLYAEMEFSDAHATIPSPTKMQFEFYKNPEFSPILKEMLLKKNLLLMKILQEGMAKGEFRPANPFLLTMSILGSLTAYAGFQNGFFLHPECSSALLPDGSIMDTEEWKLHRDSKINTEEIITFILKGIQV